MKVEHMTYDAADGEVMHRITVECVGTASEYTARTTGDGVFLPQAAGSEAEALHEAVGRLIRRGHSIVAVRRSAP